MRYESYNKSSNENNAHIESAVPCEHYDRPDRHAVRWLAKLAGISELHARAALLANRPRHD